MTSQGLTLFFPDDLTAETNN